MGRIWTFGVSLVGHSRHIGRAGGGVAGSLSRPSGIRAGRGQVGPRRLADPLRNPARRARRAMRAVPERHRRGSRQRRPDGAGAQDRRSEIPPDAYSGAARRAAAGRARPEDRQCGRRPRRLRALPAARLLCRSRDGRERCSSNCAPAPPRRSLFSRRRRKASAFRSA